MLRCSSRAIRGYLESPPWPSVHEAVRNPPQDAGIFRIRHLESGVVEEVPAGDIKAIFFAKILAGDVVHSSLQFHAHEEIVPGIWMHVKFRDGEVIEGIAENSIRYLADPGFFLRPTDPGSNNKLVYVMKNWLVDHHVLGLTKL